MRRVVLTTGGRTYPSTGATGDGYKPAKNGAYHQPTLPYRITYYF